ncbi:hypothetical protein BJM06_a00077 (plasmid) [Enterobacter cloacae]|nr:hypothetical protein BJM06_a00077 [Enterobacter cloacae]
MSALCQKRTLISLRYLSLLTYNADDGAICHNLGVY